MTDILVGTWSCVNLMTVFKKNLELQVTAPALCFCCCCLQYMIPMRLTWMRWRITGMMKKKKKKKEKTPVKNEMRLNTNHNYRCILA